VHRAERARRWAALPRPRRGRDGPRLPEGRRGRRADRGIADAAAPVVASGKVRSGIRTRSPFVPAGGGGRQQRRGPAPIAFSIGQDPRQRGALARGRRPHRDQPAEDFSSAAAAGGRQVERSGALADTGRQARRRLKQDPASPRRRTRRRGRRCEASSAARRPLHAVTPEVAVEGRTRSDPDLDLDQRQPEFHQKVWKWGGGKGQGAARLPRRQRHPHRRRELASRAAQGDGCEPRAHARRAAEAARGPFRSAADTHLSARRTRRGGRRPPRQRRRVVILVGLADRRGARAAHDTRRPSPTRTRRKKPTTRRPRTP